MLLIISIFVDSAKGQGSTLDIKLNSSDPVQYCTLPVLVAKDLTIEGNPTITGMKISFSGAYKADEDELVYTGSLSQSWSAASGTLILIGNALSTVQDYVNAIKTIKYKNTNPNPTLGVRKITISLSDVDYLPETGHFYRYVPYLDISWTDAKAKCDATSYYGLKGYLATITSEVENKFIQSKTQGVGWIGASDSAVEGVWRWVTGPEASEDGSGRLFWNGKGADYTKGVPGAGPYLGRYNDWNTGEPNDSGNSPSRPQHNEDYAHILFFANNPAASLRWNDLPNGGGGPGDYESKGYLIEFGGFPGEPTLELSATLDLQVNTMLFANKGIQHQICEDDSVMLNKADTTKATYTWTPDYGTLSSLKIANPVAKPKVPTTYFVTGIRGVCIDTATYKVPVNPKPIVNLGRDTTICNPANIVLNAGTPFSKYQWLPNSESTQTITATKNGNYSVIVTDGNQCKGGDTIKVSFTDNPKMDFRSLDTLFCGVKSVALDIKTDKGTFTLNRLSDNTIFNNLNISVPSYGSYLFNIKASDQYSCKSDTTVNIGFHKTPTIGFSIDSTKCYGYNLDVKYNGDADATSDFIWIFGGDTIKRGIGIDKYIVPLGINRAKRDLKLTVVDQGCSVDKTLYDIKVIPDLQVKVLNSLGCEPYKAQFIADNTETVTYDWTFGDGNVLSGLTSNPTNTYQHSGFYDVSLKVTTNKGCENSVKIDSMVHVAPVPVVKFSLSSSDCLEPGPNQISFAGTGLTGSVKDNYIWDLGDFAPVERLNDPQGAPGPFKFDLKTKPMATLGLTVKSEFGCESVPANITLKRKPDFSVTSDATAGCIPFSPLLSGTINDLVDKIDFTWDFGDGSTGSGSTLSHTYSQPGTKYNIILAGKSSVTQCSGEVTKTNFLQTYPKPKAAFSMDNTVVYSDKPDVKFTDLSEGAASWLWNFGDGKTSVLQNPAYHFMKVGHQTILLEVANADLCTDTVSHKLLIAFDRLFPPTGFSPNAPNKADREFLLNSDGVSTKGYHFTVLSRWNDIIFEAKEEIKGWDGRMGNGLLAPAGVYVWVLDFSDFLGRRHRQTGTVTLVY
jgi:PKD repeat protein